MQWVDSCSTGNIREKYQGFILFARDPLGPQAKFHKRLIGFSGAKGCKLQAPERPVTCGCLEFSDLPFKIVIVHITLTLRLNAERPSVHMATWQVALERSTRAPCFDLRSIYKFTRALKAITPCHAVLAHRKGHIHHRQFSWSHLYNAINFVQWTHSHCENFWAFAWLSLNLAWFSWF